jgi:hypothetical protein
VTQNTKSLLRKIENLELEIANRDARYAVMAASIARAEALACAALGMAARPVSSALSSACRHDQFTRQAAHADNAYLANKILVWVKSGNSVEDVASLSQLIPPASLRALYGAVKPYQEIGELLKAIAALCVAYGIHAGLGGKGLGPFASEAHQCTDSEECVRSLTYTITGHCPTLAYATKPLVVHLADSVSEIMAMRGLSDKDAEAQLEKVLLSLRSMDDSLDGRGVLQQFAAMTRPMRHIMTDAFVEAFDATEACAERTRTAPLQLVKD